jgi:hypothetical protein
MDYVKKYSWSSHTENFKKPLRGYEVATREYTASSNLSTS